MGLTSFNVKMKKIKMPSYYRPLCLYVLLFSVVFSFANAYEHNDSRRGSNSGNSVHLDRSNYIQLNTKNNNRNLSELNLRKEQTPHHHHQHQQQQHHFRHQNSHNSGEHRHHKQLIHQSNDNALSRIPGYPRQIHLPKKYSHYDDDNAAALNAGGGFHTKNHYNHHHQLKQEQRSTTLGPFRSRSNNRSGSWSWSSAELTNKRNASYNLSKNRQAPDFTHSSMNRNKTSHNPYMRSHHTATKHITTTTTTTTTLAPDDFQEKVFFDAQNSFNQKENDDDTTDDDDIFDYNNYVDYSDENYDTKKRSPSIGSYGYQHRSSEQSNENFQRDDPVRGNNNGINTNTLKSQHSSRSNNNNYQMNANGNGRMNDRPTIEMSKSFVETNPMTRSRNRNEPGELTEVKFQKLGNAAAVAAAFKEELPVREMYRLASAHANRIYREEACKWPKPILIPVGNYTSKSYVPHRTVLHRCSDETGCCEAVYKTCQPKYKENVTLYFWVHSKGRRFVEHLPFENHTECHCISKIGRLALSDEPIIERTITNRCRCPNLFTNVLGSQHQCKCDCTSNSANDMCNKIKVGLEHFSIAERRCIMSETCERPTCAYGEYDTKSGHCPRQDEALTFASNSLNSN